MLAFRSVGAWERGYRLDLSYLQPHPLHSDAKTAEVKAREIIGQKRKDNALQLAQTT